MHSSARNPQSTSSSSKPGTTHPLLPQKVDPKTYTFFLLHKLNNNRSRYIIQDSEGDIYWGLQSRPLELLSQLQPSVIGQLPRNKLDATQFFPPFCPNAMTKYDQNEADVFVKKQALLSGPDFVYKPRRYFDLTMREVQVAESLSKIAHPNLCKYLGVVVHPKSDRVMGLAYKQYDCDLGAYFNDPNFGHPRLSRAQATLIINSVTSAVEAMHAKYFVHCDIRPPNVFLKLSPAGESDWDESVPAAREIVEVVLGDFDAAVACGEKIELKIAGEAWRPEGVGFGCEAGFGMDRYSLRKLGEWLDRKVCRQ
ncbi:hypothetical protein CC80DRAFT_544346 [Byssothecium circinans]|uniref:Protein kinase domain-containing protein n=1 Tax=Byssothecium circinans TaxID=147558 RepID=A0A6A5U7Q9_9PLEO|nr:hypothetical protein CC80DRAFT_544346 [Byssothecium circinans]